MSSSVPVTPVFQRLDRHDIPAIMPVEREAYPDPWTQGMFRQEVTNRSSYFYVAYEGDLLIAYGGFWLVLDEAHVTKVTVRAERRGQGLGRALMLFLLEEARRLDAETVRLEVRESNRFARMLYRTLGFREVGIRAGYYTRSLENAVVMVLDFTAE